MKLNKLTDILIDILFTNIFETVYVLNFKYSTIEMIFKFRINLI